MYTYITNYKNTSKICGKIGINFPVSLLSLVNIETQ